jgi:phage gp46-like protein
MVNNMGKAPYDERNEADYREISIRIASALETMECKATIPVTQKELSKLARCSRGTLRNRRWPLERLKELKRVRHQANIYKPKKVTLEHRTAIEIHIEDKKTLVKQLDRSRSEIANWLDKYRESEIERKTLHRANEILQRTKTSLEDRVAEQHIEIAELRNLLKQAQPKNVVVSFQRASRKTLKKVLASKTGKS